MKQHIEAYAVPICVYCGKSHGTLMISQLDKEGIPLQWHHVECKKLADHAYLQRQWQRQYHKNGGL